MTIAKSCYQINISPDFSEIYSGASVGILVINNVDALSLIPGFETTKREIVLGLRKQFQDINSLKEHPVIQAYSKYYKKFDKSYHVLGQLRSVIFDNRPLPSVSPLVEAIYAVELKNMLLTAFHDLETVSFPLSIGISTGDEIYTSLTGGEKRLKQKDMMISDQSGVISSILYGPDLRTRVTPSTSELLITVYAPAGVNRADIIGHFQDIERLVSLVSPSCTTSLQILLPIS